MNKFHIFFLSYGFIIDIIVEPTWIGPVVLAFDLGVCSSQGLGFDYPHAKFGGLVWLLKKKML